MTRSIVAAPNVAAVFVVLLREALGHGNVKKELSAERHGGGARTYGTFLALYSRLCRPYSFR
jgi:hypothetical protein